MIINAFKNKRNVGFGFVFGFFSNWQFIFYSESTNLEKKAMGVGCVIHMV